MHTKVVAVMDKFDISDFLMHKNAMDVCIEVTFKNAHRTYIRYWNLGYTGKPWLVDGEEYVIPTDELNTDNWNLITPEQLTTARVNAGLPKATC